MAGRSFLLSLSLAGTIACLATQIAQASLSVGMKNNPKQLYHERKKSSQTEQIFQQLPSVENEIESLFGDVWFYSAFEPSPLVDQKQRDNEVEEVFRRALQAEHSSFLSDHLQSVGVSGGSGARRGGVRGSGASRAEPPISATNQSHHTGTIPKSHKRSTAVENNVKGIKSTKSGKNEGNGLKQKQYKKDKRGKEEKRAIDHKLTKNGKQDDKFSYDPYDADDDTYPLHEDASYDSWSWESVQEDNSAETSPVYNQGNTQSTVDDPFTFQDNDSLGGMKGWRAGPVNTATSEKMMGRSDPVMGRMEFWEIKTVDETEESAMNGSNQPLAIATAQAQPKTGNSQLKFPTIQHMVFSGPVHLKAHSSIDLVSMDPEIFAVLQSVLTPYLQKTMGPTLHAYTLEVNYTPSHDKSLDADTVETLMEVKCAFKVISDSVESFNRIDHVQASRWIHDFFEGPEIYRLLTALRSDNIPISDIFFVNQDFQISPIVTEANGKMATGAAPASKNTKKSSGGAMVGITLSVLLVGMIFFMHYTGRLPSKAQAGEFSLTACDSIAKRGAMARESIAKHGKLARKSIAKHFPRSGEEKKGNGVKGGRRRTFSGTFRRHPTGGIRKAALQKTPARSDQYLGDNASTSSSSAGGIPRTCKQSSSFADVLDRDDYSFSKFVGEYDPSNYTPSTPSRRTFNGDDVSVADTLRSDPSMHRGGTILGRVSKTVSQAAYRMSPGNTSQQQSPKTPVPSSAPRRVTAADIASPKDMDNWSIRSYQTKTPSRRSPSNHPFYREWNESDPVLRMQSSSGNDPEQSPRRKTLSIPRFTESK
eukprot:jgi/Psemu1/285981/fgenesh1_pg.112_\